MLSANKKKVLFILPFLLRLRRGIETSGLTLVNGLHNMGHDLLIYTCDGQTGLDPYSILESKKIRYTHSDSNVSKIHILSNKSEI